MERTLTARHRNQGVKPPIFGQRQRRPKLPAEFRPSLRKTRGKRPRPEEQSLDHLWATVGNGDERGVRRGFESPGKGVDARLFLDEVENVTIEVTHYPYANKGHTMSLYSAKVCKMTGRGNAAVVVDVRRCRGIHAAWQLLAPPQVTALSGEHVSATEIETICRSGIDRACELLDVTDSKFIILAAKGRIASLADLDGFALATMAAVGRALGREDSISEAALVGAGGPWERVWRRRGPVNQAHAL